MFNDSADLSSLGELLDLFRIEKKRELERRCAGMVVTSGALGQLILAGRAGLLAPLTYAVHFGEHVPSDVELSTRDNLALETVEVGPLQGRAQRAFKKIRQTFEVRRIFSAHLFYSRDHKYWYLFYFDQRDQAERENHWREGSHIHLVTDLWPNLTLQQVWERAKLGDFNFPNKIHLRYLERRL